MGQQEPQGHLELRVLPAYREPQELELREQPGHQVLAGFRARPDCEVPPASPATLALLGPKEELEPPAPLERLELGQLAQLDHLGRPDLKALLARVDCREPQQRKAALDPLEPQVQPDRGELLASLEKSALLALRAGLEQPALPEQAALLVPRAQRVQQVFPGRLGQLGHRVPLDLEPPGQLA